MNAWRVSLTVAGNRWASRVHRGEMAAGSAARYLRVFEAFCRYAVASGVSNADRVTPQLCRRFLTAPLHGDRSPTGSTAAVRLAAIRDAFDGLTEVGLAEASLVAENPTVGHRVDRPPSVLKPCPLAPDEARRLLAAGRLFSTDTLRPAAVAIALAGATHSEVARAAVADLDLTTSRLHLGSRLVSKRTIILEPWAGAALTARVSAQRREWRRCKRPWYPKSVPLAMHRPVNTYRPDSVAPTVSMDLSRAMNRAGVNRVGVRPRSCREYAANAVYARTGRVEDVAKQLGITSLDAAYRLLDWGWQQQWGQVDRGLDARFD